MRTSVSIWTPENIVLLLQLRKEGFSARQIAQRIGPAVTKNSVIGKLHRMGILLRPTPEGLRYSYIEGVRVRDRRKRRSINGRAAKRSYYLGRMWPCKAYPLPEEIDGIPTTAVSFADLEDHHCRYPFGEGSSMKFCGKNAERGSYCHHHHLKTHR